MATFEEALRGLKETNPSAWDQELVELLARHAAEEGKMLARYQHFLDGSTSPAINYLIKLILDDERRHHQVLAELANAIAWGGWSKLAPADATPDLTEADLDPALAAETKALLDAELEDEKELRRLVKELRPVGDTTLWKLVVELMMLDTRKHQRILRFIVDRLRRRGK